jgi:macrophage erythroblast attacher
VRATLCPARRTSFYERTNEWSQCTLEFDLRLQEYIELARARRTHDAKAYMNKHMNSWLDTHVKPIKQAAVLLAVPPDTKMGPYRVRSPPPFSPSKYNNAMISASTTPPAGPSLLNLSVLQSTSSTPSPRNPSSPSRSTPALPPSGFPLATTTHFTTPIVPFATERGYASSRTRCRGVTTQIRRLCV